METLIFILILMVCIIVVGFIFKNIFYILGAVAIVILLKAGYSYLKGIYYKGKTKVNKKKHEKDLEDMKKNKGKVSYVEAEVVKPYKNSQYDKSKEGNPKSFIDVEYKDID